MGVSDSFCGHTRTWASSAFVALKLLIIVRSLAEEEELEETHPLLKSLFMTYNISTLLPARSLTHYHLQFQRSQGNVVW